VPAAAQNPAARRRPRGPHVAMPLAIGARVTTRASFFDEPNCPRWSYAKYGDQADTTELTGTVIVREGDRWLVKYDVDGTQYAMPPSELRCSCFECSLVEDVEEDQAGHQELIADYSSAPPSDTDGTESPGSATATSDEEPAHVDSPIPQRGRRGGRTGAGRGQRGGSQVAGRSAGQPLGGRNSRGRRGTGRGRGNRSRPEPIAPDAALPEYLDSDTEAQG
jgi:hypothetical protein